MYSVKSGPVENNMLTGGRVPKGFSGRTVFGTRTMQQIEYNVAGTKNLGCHCDAETCASPHFSAKTIEF